MSRVLLSLGIVFLSAPALAADGKLEINQTCALATGCFPGDGPGFPVTISTPGSYQLTSDLVVTTASVHGITFADATVSNVSIDLGGFAIRGPVDCSSGSCVSTSGVLPGAGVQRVDQTNHGISVRNGSITGMGENGVWLGSNAEVSDLRVSHNFFLGILGGAASRIERNVTMYNGGAGIFAEPGSIVSGNTAQHNGASGIVGTQGSSISNNVATQNSAYGVYTNEGSTIAGNTVGFNGLDGIKAGDGSTIVGNTAYNNTGAGVSTNDNAIVRSTNSSENTGDGISVGIRSLVSDCAAIENGGDGIVAGASSSVQRSISRNNAGGAGLALDATATYREVTTGTVTGGIDMGANSCNGTASCP